MYLDDAEINTLFVNAADEQRVDRSVKQSAEVSAVMIKLQRNNVFICITRTYYRTVLRDYRTLKDLLIADLQIVHDPHFESAIFMIKEGQGRLLKITKKAGIWVF